MSCLVIKEVWELLQFTAWKVVKKSLLVFIESLRFWWGKKNPHLNPHVETKTELEHTAAFHPMSSSHLWKTCRFSLRPRCPNNRPCLLHFSNIKYSRQCKNRKTYSVCQMLSLCFGVDVDSNLATADFWEPDAAPFPALSPETKMSAFSHKTTITILQTSQQPDKQVWLQLMLRSTNTRRHQNYAKV